MLADWRYLAPEPPWDKVREAIKLAFAFSFTPHYSYANQLPVFGSAFSISLVFLVALRDARRLWLGALMATGAVLSWALTYWVDRNLQGITPALIAVTAAILIRTWEVGSFGRLGVAAVALVQIFWGGNLYFQGAERMAGAMNLLRGAMTGRTTEHLEKYRKEFVALGASLPPNAVLMLHDAHSMLGIARPVVLDWIGFQGLFDYRLYKTPRDLYERLRQVGVTHVAWLPAFLPARSKQEELIFDALAEAHRGVTKHFGAMEVFELAPEPPPALFRQYRVLAVGLGGYADGLYSVEALSTCEELPPPMQHYAAPLKTAAAPLSVWTLLDEADAAFIGAKTQLDARVAERLNRELRQVRASTAFRLLVRK
jgi:hypothetical protein